MSKKTLDPQLQAAVDSLQSKVYADPQLAAYIADTMRLVGNNPTSNANKQLMSQRSAQMTQMVKAKGLLPKDGQYTLDPATGHLVRHGGWAGLSGLEKTAIIAAAAATGVGGAAALGALGGGAAAASGAAGASSIAPTVAGGAGIAGLATPGAVAGVGGLGAGTAAGTVAGGTGIAGLLTKVGTGIAGATKLVNGINTAVNGGITPVEKGAVVNQQAQQEALNRFKEAQLAQSGPAVDAQVINNIQHTGRLAHYTPPSADATALMEKYGRRVSGVDPTTMAAAGTMQAELARRLASGQPMTMSGVPAAGAQEVSDTAAARSAALNPNGTGLTGALATGSQIAGLAPQVLDMLKLFGVGAAPNTGSPVLGVKKPPVNPYDPYDDSSDPYGDPGPVNR